MTAWVAFDFTGAKVLVIGASRAGISAAIAPGFGVTQQPARARQDPAGFVTGICVPEDGGYSVV